MDSGNHNCALVTGEPERGGVGRVLKDNYLPDLTEAEQQIGQQMLPTMGRFQAPQMR